jgi:dUTP pyrophosphatase
VDGGHDSLVLQVQRLYPDARLPVRATPQASGLDLFAYLSAPVEILPDPVHIPTGIAIAVPPGWDVQVRPRSSLSAKGVGVTLGTIDSDYRGEILVTMYRFGTRRYWLQPGDRIAQLVISRLANVTMTEVAALAPTERGSGRHGSTGR